MGVSDGHAHFAWGLSRALSDKDTPLPSLILSRSGGRAREQVNKWLVSKYEAGFPLPHRLLCLHFDHIVCVLPLRFEEERVVVGQENKHTTGITHK